MQLNYDDISSLNSVDSMKLYDMLPDRTVTSEALNANNIYNEVIDENDVDNVNCKYHTCQEFCNIDNKNTFNIIHSNVNGIIGHADDIQEITSQPKLGIDIV